MLSYVVALLEEVHDVLLDDVLPYPFMPLIHGVHRSNIGPPL